MKKSRKRLIAWMLAAVMALTCGSGAAFADEVQTEGEGAAGEVVKVEAEQPEVSPVDENTDAAQEDENTGVSPEDGNTVDGEKQTEEKDNARLGDGSEESDSAVQVYYAGYIERLSDTLYAFPGETAGFTTKLLRIESNEETGDWSVKEVDNYTVEWDVVQKAATEGEPIIYKNSVSMSKDTKGLGVTVEKTSPISSIEIIPNFYIGDKLVYDNEKIFLHVRNFYGKITDNYGDNEPSMPGDSADFTFEIGWKEYDEELDEVTDIDTSDIEIKWEVVLKDKNDEVDPTHKINEYVSYNVDGKKLHLELLDKWVDEKKYVVIEATASTKDGKYSTSDWRRIVLEKDVDLETIEFIAEAGSVISIDDLQPQVKRYNSQNPTGTKVDGCDFKFSDEYFLETKDGGVPLEGVTVGRDGKTLKIPKVADGRYVVCIYAKDKIGLNSQFFYAPIQVVNKDAAETTDDAAAGTTDGSGNDSKSDKDSAKTGDDNNLALWLVLMLLAGAGTAGTAVYTRRKRTTE